MSDTHQSRVSPMSDAIFWGLVWGALLGVLHAASSLLTHRIARRQPGARFMVVALGGLLVRLVLALLALTAGLVLGRLDPVAFVGAFFAVFALGLVAELTRTVRSSASSR